jgi:hypothetical protein
MLHKGLHTGPTIGELQVELKRKAYVRGFCRALFRTRTVDPSLPWSDEAGSAGKRGKPRARKPRKKKESAEEE